MRILKYASVNLEKLNKQSTFPSNISSYRHDMIISEHLFEKPNSKLLGFSNYANYAQSYDNVSYLIPFFFKAILKRGFVLLFLFF